jgi:hypothetical protein
MGPALARARAGTLLARSLRLGAIIAVAQLASVGVATATPTVTFKARPVPIPGFPRTGNLSGAGAAFQLELAVEGSEYGGHPPPLIGLTVILPKGTRVHSLGFPTCPAATLEPLGPGPSACPRGSVAGPPGSALATVVLGKGLVPEKATLEPFYAKGGGLELLLTAGPPAHVSALANAHYLNLAGGEGFGPSLVAELPLIAPVAGAADLSLEGLRLRLGSAFKRAGKATYHYTLPRTCRSGGSPIQAALTFAGVGGLVPQTVTATYKMPCPRRRASPPPPPPEVPAPPLPPPAVPPPVPTSLPGTGGAVTAPPNRVCLSHRDFTIHVVQLRGLAYRRVDVYVNGHPARVVRGSSITAPVDLRGLPKGRYTVRILVTTTTGRRISGTRSYHTCAASPRPFGRPRL